MTNKLPSERIGEILGEHKDPKTTHEACLLLTLTVDSIVKYLDELHEQQKPNEDKTKLLGYANRAIRTSDAVYNTDLRENI